MVSRPSRPKARQSVLFALVPLLALASRSAHAQSAPPGSSDAEAKAEALFRDGSQAFDAGHVEEACAEFGESLRLFPTLGTLLNLALCHEKQGKAASAWREFTHAAAWASEAAATDRRDFAHQHAVHLERLLSRVVIACAPETAPVMLELDGTPIDARGPLPLFLDPGPHVFVAQAPHRKRYESTMTVPATASAEAIVVRIPALEAEAPEPVPAPPRPQDPSAPSHPGRRTAGWIVGGAGVAFLGVGTYFGIDALVKLGEVGTPCTGDCNVSSAKTSEAVSVVTLGAGAAALATGVWLLFAKAPVRSAARLPALIPDVTSRSATVAIAGVW